MATFYFLNSMYKVRRSYSANIRGLTAIFSALVIFPTVAFSWGPNGHRIAAQIAQNHLTPKAAQQVRGLLKGESMAQASTWADDMRSNPRYNYVQPWHYVEIPPGLTYEKSKQNPQGDLLAALREFEKILRSKNSSPEKKSEALKFFIHFMGDLHQPLHVGRGNDRGGNLCFVHWLNRFNKSNLHEVWDTLMIASQDLSYSEYVTFLDLASEEQKKQMAGGDYGSWADESIALREKIYPPHSSKYCNTSAEKSFPTAKNQPLLNWNYRFEHMKSLEGQLQKAGFRLAEKINSIWK